MSCTQRPPAVIPLAERAQAMGAAAEKLGMISSLRFRIAAPLAVALALILVPAAQANDARVCQVAQTGHAGFTDDYLSFTRAFTAENTDNARQWVTVMYISLSSWRRSMLNTNHSTRAGKKARKAVLLWIKRSRIGGVDLLSEAVTLQAQDLRDEARNAFIDGQRKLAHAAELVLPRLRAIDCGR